MNNTDIKNRVDELCKIIQSSKLELDELRRKCPHSEHHIGNYSYRIGQIDLMRICNYCYAPLGKPTKGEIDEFVKSGAHKFS